MLRDIRQFPERASHAIAQVDGGIHSACADVRDNRLECEQVAVDVGDNGEAHELLLLCDRKTQGYLEPLRRVACVTEPLGPHVWPCGL